MTRLLIALLSVVSAGIVVSAGQAPAPAAPLAQAPAPTGTQVPISDATDSENHARGGMIEGPIAIQIHGGDVRWQPGGFWRWRNLAIKELPR